MGIRITQEQANVICKMDEHLRTLLQEDDSKLWEHTFIKKQIDKRNNNGLFTISDHIRAMVYSMLSSGSIWDRLAKEADIETGYITRVDTIFHNYSPTELLKCSPEQLQEELQENHLAHQYIAKQMEALLTVNIPKLMKFEEEYGTIDNYYQKYIQMGIKNKFIDTARLLIETLSDSKSNNKMVQMDVPLVCEYLRNVGYDLPKPDTHICRILGSEILGFSTSREVSRYQAIDIVFKLAKMVDKSVAETDYILWSYCSTGYGQICTLKKPKCDLCVAFKQCRKHAGDILDTVKNKYVLDSHYKIRESDSISEMVRKAACISYLAFRRRILQDNPISAEDKSQLNSEVEELLADRIPELLQSTDQDGFDRIHHKICEEILCIYEQRCRQSYGIAQRWLNETLSNLIIIESCLSTSKLPVMETRKYFHVPVGSDVLNVAASKGKDKFYHGLGLKCAPLTHENPAVYEMDCYSSERTQPFERWEYAEYIEFQNTLRNALKDSIKEGAYKDVIHWGFHALMETSY